MSELDLVIAVASEVFGRPVQPMDEFFELGGDSRLALEFHAVLEERANRAYDFQSLFDVENFADLATRLSRLNDASIGS